MLQEKKKEFLEKKNKKESSPAGHLTHLLFSPSKSFFPALPPFRPMAHLPSPTLAPVAIVLVRQRIWRSMSPRLRWDGSKRASRSYKLSRMLLVQP
jgi:hypothetical protein